MKITKTDKKDLADKLGKEFSSKDTFFATFSGMKFTAAAGLRDNLRPSKAKFQVVRNTVVSHALTNANLKPGDETVAKGPTAIVTMEDAEEITRVAKALVAFSKDNPGVKWKGGFYEKNWLSPEDMQKLSKIGSKTELLGQLAGTLYTAIAQIRYVLDAVKEQKEKAEGAPAPAAEAKAPEAPQQPA